MTGIRDIVPEGNNMNIIFWIIVGIIAGALARAVVPSAEGRGGWGMDLIVGLIGALIGGWVFSEFLGHSYNGWIGSTIVAFVGAVILLFVVRLFTGRGRTAV
jgi:uncharacterized membrane protein YeaQ/YmgE (transglycosylase-associated protein family)